MYKISVFLLSDLCSGKYVFGFNSCGFCFYVFINVCVCIEVYM